jgi:catechol-2,3-dioxygenase
LFACSIVKALLLYRIIRKQNYISFYGTCLGLKKHPIRRTSVITFSLDDDSTFELALDRVMKLHKNTKYELYFEVCKTLNSRHDLGSPLRFLCLERT